MKTLSGRALFCFVVFATLYLVYDLFQMAFVKQVGWLQIVVNFVFILFSMLAAWIIYRATFPLSEEAKQRKLAIEEECSLAKELLLKMEETLNEYEDLFCRQGLEKKISMVKNARRNFLAGKTKSIISIKDFEDEVKRCVKEGVVTIKQAIDGTENALELLLNISAQQREQFTRKIASGRKRLSVIEEVSKRYADFKVE
ncbi:MAG: hypothetical protein PHP62_03640 [Candidatus Moranbacteria bacterium]|nr:hypothetical protein [Candidatus Moranbacteria bacterium]